MLIPYNFDKKLFIRSTPLLEKLNILKRDFWFILHSERPITSLSISENFRLIVAGGEDGSIRVWDTIRSEKVSNVIGHVGYVRAICISHDCSIAVTGGYDSRILVWDALNWKVIQQVRVIARINDELGYSMPFNFFSTSQGSSTQISFLSISRDLKKIGIIDVTKNSWIWEPEFNQIPEVFIQEGINEIQFSRNNKFIVLIGMNKKFYILRNW